MGAIKKEINMKVTNNMKRVIKTTVINNLELLHKIADEFFSSNDEKAFVCQTILINVLVNFAKRHANNDKEFLENMNKLIDCLIEYRNTIEEDDEHECEHCKDKKED